MCVCELLSREIWRESRKLLFLVHNGSYNFLSEHLEKIFRPLICLIPTHIFHQSRYLVRSRRHWRHFSSIILYWIRKETYFHVTLAIHQTYIMETCQKHFTRLSKPFFWAFFKLRCFFNGNFRLSTTAGNRSWQASWERLLLYCYLKWIRNGFIFLLPLHRGWTSFQTLSFEAKWLWHLC